MGFVGIGAMEALVIIVAALIIFGPGRLPEVMGQAGRVLRDLRRASQELTGDFRESIDEVRQTYEEVEADMRQTAQELRRESNQIAREVNTAVNEATRGQPARRRRSRPAASQKLDQIDTVIDSGSDDVTDSDEDVRSMPAASSAASSAAKSEEPPALVEAKPSRKPAGVLEDDLLSVDDSEEDLLSLNGAHGDPKN